MNAARVFASFAVVLLLAGTSTSQYPNGATGLGWFGSSGAYTGTFCWYSSCTPAPITVTAGETVTVAVHGQLGAPFLILGAATATSCVIYPGVLDGLILDLPVNVLVSDVFTDPEPFQCPSGRYFATAVFPVSIPIGTTFAIQGLCGGSFPSFTIAIAVTVV